MPLHNPSRSWLSYALVTVPVTVAAPAWVVLALALAFAGVAAPAPAQTTTTRDIGDLGVQVRIIDRLSGVPMKLGESAFGAALRAQFLPTAEKDKMIKGYTEFEWGVQVLEFKQKPKAVLTGPRPEQDGEAQELDPKRLEELWRQKLEEKFGSKDFAEYVDKKDPSSNNRKFVIKKKAVSERGSRPAFHYYEYYDEGAMMSVRGVGQDTFWRYHLAAAYQLEKREVVVLFHWPVFKKPKPDKWKRAGKKMVESLELIGDRKVREIEGNAAKDKYANTPERKETLERALENIKSLKGWDYYTSPNYVCLFSWDPTNPGKRKKSLDFARTTTDQMEEVRELYEKYFPPHKEMQNYYPVLRICHNQELFESYGGMGGGVVGWFNTGSKELVIFFDVDGVYGGKKGTKATSFHEGWHQYADAYFGSGNFLHRWFGEGMGDWFGAWSKSGSRWTFTPDASRIRGVAGIVMQVRTGKHVPLKEIISWNMDKFYGPRAVYYYSQGYAMVDFFRRGKQKLGHEWDDAWNDVIDNYRKGMLELRDQKKALDLAFGQLDMDKLEEGWKTFVLKQITKK